VNQENVIIANEIHPAAREMPKTEMSENGNGNSAIASVKDETDETVIELVMRMTRTRKRIDVLYVVVVVGAVALKHTTANMLAQGRCGDRIGIHCKMITLPHLHTHNHSHIAVLLFLVPTTATHHNRTLPATATETLVITYGGRDIYVSFLFLTYMSFFAAFYLEFLNLCHIPPLLYHLCCRQKSHIPFSHLLGFEKSFVYFL
jgi:hypothetical protein